MKSPASILAAITLCTVVATSALAQSAASPPTFEAYSSIRAEGNCTRSKGGSRVREEVLRNAADRALTDCRRANGVTACVLTSNTLLTLGCGWDEECCYAHAWVTGTRSP